MVGAGTGTTVGAGTGKDVGTGTGTAVGAGTGKDVGAGTGTDVGAGSGIDVGAKSGTDVGAESGTAVGIGSGTIIGAGIGTAVSDDASATRLAYPSSETAVYALANASKKAVALVAYRLTNASVVSLTMSARSVSSSTSQWSCSSHWSPGSNQCASPGAFICGQSDVSPDAAARTSRL